MHAIEIIQATLAPLLLVSSTGLLILGLGNRMGRVIDRLREFSREMRVGVSEERKEVIMKQKGVLIMRAKLCRNAMVHFHLTILFAALSSLFTFLATIADFIQYVSLLFFTLSIVTLIIGAIYAVFEISLSYTAILRESSVYLK